MFRIGGDEFCLLTASSSPEYAEALGQEILSHNGETFSFEGREFPLSLIMATVRFRNGNLKYDALFTELHQAIRDGKKQMA